MNWERVVNPPYTSPHFFDVASYIFKNEPCLKSFTTFPQLIRKELCFAKIIKLRLKGGASIPAPPFFDRNYLFNPIVQNDRR